MPHVIVDTESAVLSEHFAVIHSHRRNRKRFPAGCVSLVADAETAMSTAESAPNLHPAVVYGPSVSSESQRIFYLVRWLDTAD